MAYILTRDHTILEHCLTPDKSRLLKPPLNILVLLDARHLRRARSEWVKNMKRKHNHTCTCTQDKKSATPNLLNEAIPFLLNIILLKSTISTLRQCLWARFLDQWQSMPRDRHVANIEGLACGECDGAKSQMKVTDYQNAVEIAILGSIA